MDLSNLRLETQAEHQATESVMPLMHPGLTRNDYTKVLCRLYHAVRSWEEWAVAHVPPDLSALLKGRQRSELILRDLLALGTNWRDAGASFQAELVPGLRIGDPAFRSSFLGAMYVMEGSTLGGQHIARHLEETLGLSPGEGNAYFRGYAERTGEMWRAFKATLAEVAEGDSEYVIAAAKAMFGIFRAGMVEQVEPHISAAQRQGILTTKSSKSSR